MSPLNNPSYKLLNSRLHIWLTQLNKSVNCWNIYLFAIVNEREHVLYWRCFCIDDVGKNIRLYNAVWCNTIQQHHKLHVPK